LPRTDGYELADLMRGTGHKAGVRYFALSGFGQAIDKQRSAAAGFAAHLVKPLALDSLATLLDI
jgi:CheY-like chemotaxis protein